MALLDIFQPLLQRLIDSLGPFGKVFTIITNFWTKLKDSWTKGLELTRLVQSELAAWKTFREAIPYRTGVISIPAAVDKTQQLIDQVVAAWDAIKDLAFQLKGKFDEMGFADPAAEARTAIEEIRVSRFRDLLNKFPRLARALEKFLAWLGILLEFITLFESMVDDFTAIVIAIKGIREEVETGSTVFLSQKNRRKNLALQRGGSIQIRVGSLHSE